MSERRRAVGILVLILTASIFSFAATDRAYAILDAEGGWLPEKAEWMPEFDTSTAFLTKYIWRGQNLGDEPVIQVDNSLSKWGWTLDVLFNYSTNTDKTTDGGRYKEITELDYTVSYETSIAEIVEQMNWESWGILDPIGLSTGYTFYTFPNLDFDEKGWDSHEFFNGISYDILLQPFFTWYWDIDAGNGSYLQFGGSHSFELAEDITFDVGLAFGYNYSQWTDDKKGWSDMLFTAEVPIPIFNYFTITPSIGYSVILDHDTYDDAQENEFYGGVTAGFTY